MTVYFGYGSNLWLDQMKRRCPENKLLGYASLPDWCVLLRKARVLIPSMLLTGYGSSMNADMQILFHPQGISFTALYSNLRPKMRDLSTHTSVRTMRNFISLSTWFQRSTWVTNVQ